MDGNPIAYRREPQPYSALMSSASTSPAPPVSSRASIWRWVLATALLWQLGNFVIGLVALHAQADSMNSSFSESAVTKYMGYMIAANGDVFLKAYLPVLLGLALIAYPVVTWSLRKRSTVSRWSIMWRTALICFGLTAFFTIRTMAIRPWLLNGLDANHWYFLLRSLVPGAIRDHVAAPLATAFPWILTGSVTYFYLSTALRGMARSLGGRARHGMAIVLCAILGGTAWAIPAYRNRIDETVREDARPNVLILASDSLRANRLSINGYPRPTSPTIDALAAKSVNFTKCFTPIASTVESMTSMMSSQYPHTHGLQHMFPNRTQVEKVKDQAPALAQLLRDQGYDTAVIGDWCAGVFDLMPMGFEKVQATTFDNFKVYMSQAVYLSHGIMPLYFDNPVGYWLFPKLESSAFYVTPDVVTDRVVNQLARQTRSPKPFFWTVFYSCTHIPYTAGPAYGKLFTDPNYDGEHQHQFKFDVNKWIGSTDMAENWQKTSKADVTQINGLYDGCVRKFDDCVKQVLDQLKTTGLDKNTIILVTADHGDDLCDPNTTFGHGLSFNGGDQNSNIPAVFYIPGNEANARPVDRIVRTLDFAPTILDLCQTKTDSRMEGKSLSPYLRKGSIDLGLPFFGETSYLFCKRFIPGEEPMPPPESMDATTAIDESFDFHFVLKDKYQDLIKQTKERVLRTQDWKLVFTPGKHYDIVRLYHVKTDPHCLVDVSKQNPATFATMKEHLWQWMLQRREAIISEIFPQGEPAPIPGPPV
jgi:arylsulfatase A-like enzyme